MMAKNHERIRPKKLRSSEVKTLLGSGGVRDAELSQIGAGEALLLPDGRLLFRFEDGKGILYETRDQLVTMLRKLEQNAGSSPKHPAEQLLPQGENFPSHVPELLQALPGILGLPSAALDRTEESLNVVEDAVRRRGYRRILTAERLPALVAYVGEVMRQAVHGKWQMYRDPNTKAWEPVIVDPNDKVYQPFATVYLELQRGAQGSIRGAVHGVLRAHLLSGGRRPT
jgi:hypothetical protein